MIFKNGLERPLQVGPAVGFPRIGIVVGNPENAVALGIVLVVAQLVLYKKRNEDTGGNAHGKASDLNGGIDLIPFQVAP